MLAAFVTAPPHRPCPPRVNTLSCCCVEQAETVWGFTKELSVLLTAGFTRVLHEIYIFP